MTLKLIVPTAALVALGSVALPARSAPLGVSSAPALEQTPARQAHYRYRHHRYYRYYRAPYFYYGHRRHWRHHRRW